MRFYRNVGGSFQELTGSENPFRDLAFGMDGFSSCPTFVDLDKDDVLELVLGTTDGNLFLSSHPLFFLCGCFLKCLWDYFLGSFCCEKGSTYYDPTRKTAVL